MTLDKLGDRKCNQPTKTSASNDLEEKKEEIIFCITNLGILLWQ